MIAGEKISEEDIQTYAKVRASQTEPSILYEIKPVGKSQSSTYLKNIFDISDQHIPDNDKHELLITSVQGNNNQTQAVLEELFKRKMQNTGDEQYFHELPFSVHLSQNDLWRLNHIAKCGIHAGLPFKAKSVAESRNKDHILYKLAEFYIDKVTDLGI